VDAPNEEPRRSKEAESKSESPTEWTFKTRTGLVHSSENGWTCENGTCGGSKAPCEVDAVRAVACNCTKDVGGQEKEEEEEEEEDVRV